MPFFTIPTPHFMKRQPMPLDQVEAFCREQSLEYLQDLKQRMRAFFGKESTNRRSATAEILAIDVQIKSIEMEILENQEQIERAEANNQRILSNLPGNGAERYLAFQQMYSIPSIRTPKEDEIRKLQARQVTLQKDIKWINGEFIRGDLEYTIVNKIIDEKTPKVAPAPIPEHSMRF